MGESYSVFNGGEPSVQLGFETGVEDGAEMGAGF
jgi:hypothetical protein